MVKNYLHIIILFIVFYSASAVAQEGKQSTKIQETSFIEGLNLYPNPVSNGKIYVSTKNDSEKNIVIFDVLGKKVLQATITNKELNISSIFPGVYIIKITEGEATATRKLIVK
jgi:adenylate kinase family enzyme